MKFYSTLAWSLLVLSILAWLSGTLALERALVEVVIYEHSSGGDYTTYTYELEGTFSNAGAATSAEGDILEVRAVSFLLSNTDRFSLTSTYKHLQARKISAPTRVSLCGFVYLDSLHANILVVDLRIYFLRAIFDGLRASIFDLFTQRRSKTSHA